MFLLKSRTGQQWSDHYGASTHFRRLEQLILVIKNQIKIGTSF